MDDKDKCTLCGGKGWVPDLYDALTIGGADCPSCNGTGLNYAAQKQQEQNTSKL